MTDRKKTCLFLVGLLSLLVLFYSRILLTDKIIRAPDIIAEFYWGARSMADQTLAKLLQINLYANWDNLTNSGFTNEGGGASWAFLIPLKLIFWLFPFPASIAWCIVLHLFFGACGTYLCCRMIGTSRFAAFLGGAIFALAPEIASLINAGHVMKIATISYAPWAFYFLERGFQTRRYMFFLTTAVVLAFQFFNTHWQIAFYTCLCVGAYGVFRLAGILVSEGKEGKKLLPRLLGMNAILLVFFLTTVSISLLPLANWSRDTNRGAQSGANQGSGGLQVDEAMSWSMPPEELATLVVPGFFGLSRQEGGDNPKNIASYYWGRMHFTQTTDYMGLLPWLLLPLPLIFRRDRYTWLALGGIVGGLLFSFGQYTPFYWLLYKFFPGINHFRVPKMMMFIPVMGVAVMAARGIDLLRDEHVRKTAAFRRYLIGVCAVPAALLLILGIEIAAAGHWIGRFADILSQPTRYEQGPQLIEQRWNNLVQETMIATGISAVYGVVFCLARKQRVIKVLPWLLLLLFVGDTWRVNNKFLFLTAAPVKAKEGEAPPLIKFLSTIPKTYRVLPMDGSDPMQYIAQGIPVMFTSNAVQQNRWQQILDSFNPIGPITDMLNVKYLIMPSQEYQKQKIQLDGKFTQVFSSPNRSSLVLENRAVLPKAWIVPSALLVTDPSQRLAILQNPGFHPLSVAVVEAQPPLAMANPNDAVASLSQSVKVPVYEGEHIVVEAATPRNALLVLGEKYYQGWKATVDGRPSEIVPVDHILRGVYLDPGKHKVDFVFDPLPFKIGKYLTLTSFVLFAGMLIRELLICRRKKVH